MAPDQVPLEQALSRAHQLGMIGGELEEQLAHCAGFSSVLGRIIGHGEKQAVQAADLGTGGGLPGVALAWWNPGLSWILIESRTSRATEVERAVLALDMADRVLVRAELAEVVARDPEVRERLDLVVARSFGPPAMVAEAGAALLAVGGMLVVSEPPTTPQDRWPLAGLAALGLGPAETVESDGYHFAVVTKLSAIGDGYPRSPAKPTRNWPKA